MSGGGSFGRNRSSARSAPWSGLQPYLTDVYRQAQHQFQQGVPQYYPGATYTPFNPIQQAAMGATLQRAQGSPQEQQLAQLLSGQLTQPQVDLTGAADAAGTAAAGTGAGQNTLAALTQGINLGQAGQFARQGSQPFLGQLGDIAGGGGTLGGAIGEVQGAVDPAAQQALASTAAGESLTGNPFLDRQFQQASRAVGEQFQDITNPAIASTFGAAGRTGGGLHSAAVQGAQAELGEQLGDLATDIYGQNYQLERDRQLAAAGQLGQLGLGQAGLGADIYGQRQGRALGAATAGGQLGLGQQRLGADLFSDVANRQLQAGQALQQGGLQGAQTLGDLYGQIGQQQLGAAGMVPALSGLQYGNIDRLRGVGEDVYGLQQDILADDINRFNYYQQAPQEALARYAAIIQAQALQQSRNRGSGFTSSGYGGVGAGGGGGFG